VRGVDSISDKPDFEFGEPGLDDFDLYAGPSEPRPSYARPVRDIETSSPVTFGRDIATSPVVIFGEELPAPDFTGFKMPLKPLVVSSGIGGLIGAFFGPVGIAIGAIGGALIASAYAAGAVTGAAVVAEAAAKGKLGPLASGAATPPKT